VRAGDAHSRARMFSANRAIRRETTFSFTRGNRIYNAAERVYIQHLLSVDGCSTPFQRCPLDEGRERERERKREREREREREGKSFLLVALFRGKSEQPREVERLSPALAPIRADSGF